MATTDDRIAAHPVARAVDLFRGAQLAARRYGPGADAAVRAFEAALVTALDAEDRQRAETLADLRDIHLQVVTGAFDRSELEPTIYALIKKMEG